MNESMDKIQENFWDSFNKVADELAKTGIKIQVPDGILKRIHIEYNNEKDDIEKKRNDYLEIGTNNQPIYLVISNKISNVCFDTERVDNYNGIYEKAYLKENLLKSLGEIKKLENEYPKEFNSAFARAVKMYLNSAMINLVKPINEWKEMNLNKAIMVIKLFKSLEDFEKEYFNKINKLKKK